MVKKNTNLNGALLKNTSCINSILLIEAEIPLDIKTELLRFCTEHVRVHGADWRSEKYINECCDLWVPKYGRTAERVRAEALKFWKEKGGK